MVFSLLNRNIHTMQFKSMYLTDLKYVNIQSDIAETISGNSVGSSFLDVNLAAMGEYFEREAMNYNSISPSKYGLYIRTGEKVLISSSVGEQMLLDSCGLASHIQSRFVFENALAEFIERQSLIFNYLSKSTGKYIDLSEYPYKVPIEYKKLRFFDISIIPSFYVILGFGKIGNKFYIGLGSSVNLHTAMQKCIKEINQFYIAKYIKSAINLTIKDTSTDVLDYSNVFSNLTIDQLKSAYSYLDYSKKSLKNSSQSSTKEILEELYSMYGIDPILATVDAPRKNLNQIIIKIFDLNWFPNMCPYTFPKEIYDFVESITGKKLDRKCTIIPFP